jgi:hypothetical protein
MNIIVLLGAVALAGFLNATTAISSPGRRPTPPATATASGGVAASDSEKLEQIRRDVASLKEKQRKRLSDPDVLLPFLATLTVAIGGWIFAWKVAKHTGDSARRQKNEDRVFDSLKLLSEGSQSRGIALGLIEAYWDEMPNLQGPWITVVANQAIHLLTRSKERDSFVELDNVHRMFALWERVDRISGKPVYRRLLNPTQRSGLREALKFATKPDEHETGVKVPNDFAGLWYLRLWGVPDDKIDAYLADEKSLFDIQDDIEEGAFA